MSQQNAATPREFIDAVEKKFGVTFVFDLACTTEDCIVPCGNDPDTYRGYFFDQGVDALEQDWSKIIERFRHLDSEKIAAWLNPPFKKTPKFAKKCSQGTDLCLPTDDPDTSVYEPGIRIFSVFPIGACTDWFADYVLNQAAVWLPRPRLTFIDPTTGQPFMSKRKFNEKTQKWVEPKLQTGLSDVMLVDWAGEPGVYEWRWKEKKRRTKKEKKKATE